MSDLIPGSGAARRSAFPRAIRASGPLVSAWASANTLTLGQVKTAEKSTKSPPSPSCCMLELQGCIVTIDAMGCQQEIAWIGEPACWRWENQGQRV